MLVENLLPRARERLVTMADDAMLVDAARLFNPGTEIVVVCNQIGSLAGVVTKTDVVSRISHCEGASCRTPLALVMTRTVTVCHPGDLLNDVWSVMKRRQVQNIPITDPAARPVGVLNARDALQMLLRETEDEELLLREYVMGMGYH